MSCAWTEGRSCLRELVLSEAKLFFGVFRRQPVLDVPSASAPGQGSGFSFTADPGRARALDAVLDVPIASAPGQGSGFGRWEPVDLVSTALSLELQELSLVVPLVA